MIDMVVHRKELKSTLAKLLNFFSDDDRDFAEDALDQARKQGL
jgi:acetyl-CoA carboxylase beta subunit